MLTNIENARNIIHSNRLIIAGARADDKWVSHLVVMLDRLCYT